MRKPKDRDFIETIEGAFFCVVGYLHPPKAYTSYLKYLPAKIGKWKRGDVCYRRTLPYYNVAKVGETLKFLERDFPQYLYYCPVRHITMSMVPRRYVKRYHSPEERLKEIASCNKTDSLEKEAFQLASVLTDQSGVKIHEFGITGSVLLGIHSPRFSDIDLTVYGLESSTKVKEVLRETAKTNTFPLRKLSDEEVEKWCLRKSRCFPLSFKDLTLFASRKWNYGILNGRRLFSIHPIRKDDEIQERYGDKLYFHEGTVYGEAAVSDSRESVFLPAIYQVEDLEIVKGKKFWNIKEIVSYEGLYCDVAKCGERVEFRGKLERVEAKGQKPYYRILIGSTELGGSGYMRPLGW